MNSTENKSTGLFWILFVISLAVMIMMLLFVTAWFWLVLPFVLTFFAKGMDWL